MRMVLKLLRLSSVGIKHMLKISPPLAWSTTRVFEFYRSLGFFEDRSLDSILFQFDREPDPSTSWFDFSLFYSVEQRRTLALDPEFDVANGNDRYVEFFSELERLSNGAFRPCRVNEMWESDEGPVLIKLIQKYDKAENFEFNVAYREDWLDLEGVVSNVNQILSQTTDCNRQFELAWDAENNAVIFFISKNTKEEMIKKRSFPFWDVVSSLLEL